MLGYYQIFICDKLESPPLTFNMIKSNTFFDNFMCKINLNIPENILLKYTIDELSRLVIYMKCVCYTHYFDIILNDFMTHNSETVSKENVKMQLFAGFLPVLVNENKEIIIKINSLGSIN